MKQNEHISINPEVLSGKPVLWGTRLAVDFITELVRQGWSADDIQQGYLISAEQIRACLDYADAHRVESPASRLPKLWSGRTKRGTLLQTEPAHEFS